MSKVNMLLDLVENRKAYEMSGSYTILYQSKGTLVCPYKIFFCRAITNCKVFSYGIMGTSKNRFEKGKWVECAECDESRRSKAVCLTRRFDEADGVLYTFSLKRGF